MNIFIFCGGQSAEHEVSLNSALGIFKNFPKKTYKPYLLAIDKEGRWRMHQDLILSSDIHQNAYINPDAEIVSLDSLGQISGIQVDMVFPIIHGKDGEDGNLQGFLNMYNIPFVGSDTLATALAMDKVMTKNILTSAGIPVAKYIVLKSYQEMIQDYEIKNNLGYSIFVKPSNAGSSIGVSKCDTFDDIREACCTAFQYDHCILLEEAIEGREIEVAILGNENPIASEIGEIISTNEFYSYNAKYVDADGAKLKYPMTLNDKIKYDIQHIAVQSFLALGCKGMARVDLFLKKDGSFVVNEINTHPGFTNISMYPKLFEVSGINYSKLIHKLIQYAINYDQQKKKLTHNYVN